MDLYKGNKKAGKYELSARKIAIGFAASRFAENWRLGWPLDRALRVYITAPESEGGLNSAFYEDAYADTFNTVLEHMRRRNR